jgi:hypothetical protein
MAVGYAVSQLSNERSVPAFVYEAVVFDPEAQFLSLSTLLGGGPELKLIGHSGRMLQTMWLYGA